MKKSVCILLSVLLLLGSCSLWAFAEEKPLNYLLLGDSITEGFGVKNPSEASYGKIVADTNGYNYINESKMARDSSELIELMKTNEAMRAHIAEADIISLSIGSNDYLSNDHVVGLVIGALLGINDKQLDRIADNYYDNLCTIIAMIKEMNPDTVILMQNVYCAWTGFAETAFRAGADRVNAVIDRYIQEHPGEINLCVIAPAMTGHPENLADDCVHPNAKGNVEIARLVLLQLKEMGLGENTEPVVNVQGIDYNYYDEKVGTVFGPTVTVLVKWLTGNSVNINRGHL